MLLHLVIISEVLTERPKKKNTAHSIRESLVKSKTSISLQIHCGSGESSVGQGLLPAPFVARHLARFRVGSRNVVRG
jgi:hypothetical protein